MAKNKFDFYMFISCRLQTYASMGQLNKNNILMFLLATTKHHEKVSQIDVD